MLLLFLLFLLTAFLYASVGFGGGSTYNALLVLHGTDYRILPAIALVCNIVVVIGGDVHSCCMDRRTNSSFGSALRRTARIIVDGRRIAYAAPAPCS